MKLLFVVDHIFLVDEYGDVYTNAGKFPYSSWDTYLVEFDEVTVFARSERVDVTQGQARASGPRVHFEFASGRRGVSRILDARVTKDKLAELIENADAVVCRLPCESGLTAIRIAKSLGKPVLVEVVACAWDALWNHGAAVAKLYAGVAAWRTRKAVQHAQLVRYVSQSFLQKRYPTLGEQFVASNVLLELVTPNVTYPIPLKDKRIIFGTIGGLHHKLKGIDTAIASLAGLKRRIPSLELEYRILGEGDPSWLKSVQAGIKGAPSVKFDGVRPPGEAVYRWLDGIDVYLQPSFQEGLPRALIEALSRKLICVGSTAGGIPELLPSERMHRPGDVNALTDRLMLVVEALPEELELEAERNRKTASRYEMSLMRRERRRSVEALSHAARKAPCL